MIKKFNFKDITILILATFIINISIIFNAYGIEDGNINLKSNVMKKEIRMEPLALKVGENLDLNYYMYEENKDIEWKSSQPNILEVDENGVVEAKNNGTVNIDASTEGKTYKFLIVVDNKFNSIKYYSNPKERKNNDGKYRVFIDPGHGGHDAGSSGPTGLEEKELTLDISKRVLSKLEKEKDIITKCSRTTDVGFSTDEAADLKVRTDMANEFKADIFVCIHANAFGDENVSGTETFYYESYNNIDKGSIESKKLAKYVHNNLIETLKSKDRKLKPGNDLFVIKTTNMPAILSEVDFISNPEIESKMKTNEYRDAAANSIYEGIMEYLDINTNDIINVTGVKLNKHDVTLKKDNSEKLIANVEPSNATDKRVRWISSNESIAKVDSNGNIIGVEKGNAKITAISEDGQFEDYVNIVVTDDMVAERISGENRYKTNYKISEKGWKNGEAEYVVLASGEEYVDALCSVPLASQYNAPILLTKKDYLDNELTNEIKRLGAKKVFIIGGEGAISKKVEEKIYKSNLQSERIGGKNRYETSILISKKLKHGEIATVVSGNNFPDAISIASIAAILKSPVILTDKNYIPKEVKDYMEAEKFNKTYLIGGEGAISLNVEKQLDNVKRISGKNRYETNKNIITEFNNYINYDDLYLAIGNNYPDALSCGALAGKNGNAVLLTDGNENNYDLKNFINNKKSYIDKVLVIGSDELISDKYLKQNDIKVK